MFHTSFEGGRGIQIFHFKNQDDIQKLAKSYGKYYLAPQELLRSAS